MKRCPECRRDYTDETLNFCLDDGTALLDGPSSMDEPRTVRLPDTGESPTALIDESATAILSDPNGRVVHVRSRGKWLAAAGVVLLAFIGAGVYKFWPESTKLSTQAIKIERLTTNGRSVNAAISPDGKFYVYTVDEGGKDSLWVRQLAASRDIQIIPAEEDVYYWGLTFTPDSNYINFSKVQFEKNVDWTLFQMPVLGGTQKMLIDDADGGVSYSPDGKQFAYFRPGHPNPGEDSLLVANAADGTGARIVATLKSPQSFLTRGRSPAWSPRGDTIACMIRDESVLSGSDRVVEISVADGTIEPVSTQEWNELYSVAWLPEKRGLVVLGSERSSKTWVGQIWRFSYPDGQPQRITTDLNDYRSLALTSDANSLVTVRSNTISNIWVAPNGDASRASQIRSGGNNSEGQQALNFTPDGRIVFGSTASGVADIWIMNADGSDPKQLTADAGENAHAMVTPDGRYIVFTSFRNEQVNIWRMGLDGSGPIQLTQGRLNHSPSISPDSGWVIYTDENSVNPYLSKVSIDGGEAVRLVDKYSQAAEVSPDGKWIICSYRKDDNSTWRYAVLPFEGGEPVKIFDLIGKNGDFRWSSDSRSVYYPRDGQGGVTNIWNLPLDDKPAKQVTDFKTEKIFGFAFSRDGKQMVLSRGTRTSDVVLIKDFR
jgi:Tol biopolymer transport system component